MTPDRVPHPGTEPTAMAPGAAGLDLSRPQAARVYAHWLGGKDTFGPDRDTAEKVAALAPWVVAGARANRAFLRRAVGHLARTGVDQFLDLGSGLPAPGNVHQVAQGVDPAARVVYVDHDPIVLVHAKALLACDERTIAVLGDLRDPTGILTAPDVRVHLDLTRPVAVLLLAVLHFVADTDDPAGIVSGYRDRLAPGSAIVISHAADLPDPGPGPSDRGRPSRAAATREAAAVYEELAGPLTLRTREQITGLFHGLDLLDPGVVPANQWRPPRSHPRSAVPILAGIGQVPDPDTPSPQGRG